MAKQPLALVEYIVRIVAPAGQVSNEIMDNALATVRATMEYNENLRKLIYAGFIEGVDSLGGEGFTVEVRRVEE